VSNETEILDTRAAGPAAIRGSAIRMVAYGASILLAFASAPLLIRHLGVEEFGRYALVGSLLALVTGLTDAGIVSVAQREYVSREPAARLAVLRHLLGLRLALSIVAVGVAIGFAAVAGYGSTLVAGTAIAGVGFVFLGAQAIFSVPLLTRLQLGRITAVDLLRQVLTVGLIVWLVAIDGSLLAFLAITLPVSVVVTVLTGVMARGLAPLRPTFDTGAWWELLKDTIPFAAATAITAVYFRISLVLLDLVASDLETGYYATSYRILEVVIAIPALLVSAVFPVIARAAEADEERLRYIVGRVTETGLILGPWMALCLILGADTIIDVIAGDEGAPAADVLRIQAPAVIATFIAVGCAFPLLSLRRHREVLVANVAALVGSVTLTLALAPWAGAEGAAAATVVAELLLAGGMAVMLRRARPSLRVPLGSLPPIALATALATATLLLPVHEAIRVVLATGLYFGVLALLGRIPEELRDALSRGATQRA
jgi:O-antigen/teichoic acid export membrane protein